MLSILLVHRFAGIAHSQVTSVVPHFEVVSVKRCTGQTDPPPGGRKGDALKSSPDRLHLTCQTLMNMIQWAYVNFADARFNPLASAAISGGPAWVNTDRFQVDAKSATSQASGIMNGPMLRTLLEDRFGLVIRRDVKETAVYALTVAKSGALKVRRSAHTCRTVDPEQPLPIEPGKPFPVVCGMSRTTEKGYDAVAVTMTRFAELLSDYADRRVVDRTGLSGEFDIHLDLFPSDLGHPSGDAIDDRRDLTEIFARVQGELQRLGLHIQASKGQVEALFIERAERPSAN